MTTYLDQAALQRALHLRDLSDPAQGEHAMQQLVADIHILLGKRWSCPRLLQRRVPLVFVSDNYDNLGYLPEAAARDARYTRYISAGYMLRSQMSALIPETLRSLALDPPEDLLIVCPGLVYRRDSIDRTHVGEPHQLDLWRITKRSRMTPSDLNEMILTVIEAVLPGSHYRTTAALHPYTTDGLQIDVEVNGTWLEIGECGLAAPQILAQAGLDTAEVSGLAMGLGLDRLLMIRKGISDIRLLRATDPRVAQQMLDLRPYKPVSNQPAIRRDISVAVQQHLTAEELGDRVRQAMADRVDELESLEIMDETPWEELPPTARSRMGMHEGQKNVLLRLTIRHPVKTLTSLEANELRNQVYGILHEGENREWA
ncbi:hypothetical protein [Azotobacter chroococcum]|uniref:Phenylalanyl-tRNA synthetase n=1 Tax=Azotobacter chroococcum TaxID=353 RepID=A0AAP9YHA2_9GAMM|nr:hypothetical protein [Azotobacter chroococcum]QQE91171.1 hypothetical protein GKQ51_22055 [Azotobacter chroococcum]